MSTFKYWIKKEKIMIDKHAVLAVVFDVDGTLLDTREFIYRAFEHTFDTHQLRCITREEISKLMGQPLVECYRLLVPGSSVEAFCNTHRAFQAEHLYLAIPFEHTESTLRELHRGGIRMAVVTSRSRQNSIRTLELAGIQDYFEVIVSLEDVSRHKPFPDAILKVLEQMGVEPRNSIIVGDMNEDIIAGKNAHVRTVAATYGFQGVSLTLNKPDYVIHDIQELVTVVKIIYSKLRK